MKTSVSLSLIDICSKDFFNSEIIFCLLFSFVINSNLFSKLISSFIYLSLGLINIISEDYNLAKENFIKAIKINENDYSLFNRIGVVCQNENNINEAIYYYNKALEINNNYPRCLINLGIAYFNLDDYNSSLKYFISALKLNNNIPEVWNYLSSIFISIEREDLLNKAYQRDLNYLSQILL